MKPLFRCHTAGRSALRTASPLSRALDTLEQLCGRSSQGHYHHLTPLLNGSASTAIPRSHALCMSCRHAHTTASLPSSPCSSLSAATSAAAPTPPPPTPPLTGMEELAIAADAIPVEVHREQLRVALAACCAAEKLKTERLRRRGVPYTSSSTAGTTATTNSASNGSTGVATPTSGTGWVNNKRAKFWSMILSGDTKPFPEEDEVAARESKPPRRPSPVTHSSHPPATSGNSETGGGGAAASASAAVAVAPPSKKVLGRVRRRLPNILYRNKYKQHVAQELTAVLNRDEALGQRLLEKLSADSRRLLLVMGTASEFYGEDYRQVAEQVHLADRDRDSAISSTEYDEWAKQSIAKRYGTTTVTAAAAAAAAGAASGTTTPSGNVATTSGSSPAAAAATPSTAASPSSSATASTGAATTTTLSWHIYFRLLLTAALPFLAFGTLDNTILVLAGEGIDRHMSLMFGFSSLAAAGFGGVVSGVAGIQVHGLAERWVGKVAPEPKLTPAQRSSPAYDRTYRVGSTVGMVVGLLIGMTPLLFLRSSEEEEQEQDWEEHNFSMQRLSLESDEESASRAIAREEAAAWKAIVQEMTALRTTALDSFA